MLSATAQLSGYTHAEKDDSPQGWWCLQWAFVTPVRNKTCDCSIFNDCYRHVHGECTVQYNDLQPMMLYSVALQIDGAYSPCSNSPWDGLQDCMAMVLRLW